MESTKSPGSPNLLFIIGSLWLVLAAWLLYFQMNPAINVEWNTATELQTAGFNLYRSPAADGEFVQINDKLIPSQGDGLTGASYTYRDKSVTSGETFYYLLEEVELDASTNRYENDIFSYTVPSVMWWAVVLTAVSLLAGLAFIVMGIRENKN
ncbi:MAG: hypothetical protein H6667_24145 [Ardenticatenaceae bacterium]|nr:hypothetical protein [Ardenticatenaceae bacterium]